MKNDYKIALLIDCDKSKPNCCRKVIASGATISQTRAPRFAKTASQKTN